MDNKRAELWQHVCHVYGAEGVSFPCAVSFVRASESVLPDTEQNILISGSLRWKMLHLQSYISPLTDGEIARKNKQGEQGGEKGVEGGRQTLRQTHSETDGRPQQIPPRENEEENEVEKA